MSKITDAVQKIYKPLPSGAEFTLPQDFPAFEGHFPGDALLPAVVQIELALFAISKQQDKKALLKGVKKAKFTAPVRPGDTISLTVLPKEGGVYDISIKKEGAVLSTFQITVE